MKSKENLRSKTKTTTMLIKVSATLIFLLCALVWIFHRHFERFFIDGHRYFFAKQVMREKNDNRANSVRTIILGDSTAMYNVNPLRLDQAISVALPHSSVMVSYYQLIELIKKGYKPRQIVFSNSYDWLEHYGPNFFKYIVAMGFLRPSQLLEAEEFTGFQVPKNLDEFYSRIELLAYSYTYRSGLPLLSMAGLQFAMRNAMDQRYSRRIEAIFKYRGRPNHRMNKSPYYNHKLFNQTHSFVPSPIEDAYLKAFVEKAESVDAKVYYIYFPYGEGINLNSYENFLRQRKEHINQILTKADNVRVLDYEAAWPDSLFEDLTHLNLNGATIISNRVRKAISDKDLPQ